MITRLTLTNFRNHKSFRIDGAERIVALAGPNGAGKTNILEALSLLGGGTGMRGDQAEDIANFETADDWAVAAEISDGPDAGCGAAVSVFWEGRTRRRAKINGEARPLSALAELLGVVWLTPAEDLLFVGSAANRRAFFDNLAAGFDPAHLGRTARLSKLLSERSYALKNGGAAGPDENWLDRIDDALVSTAAAVADGRVRFAAELNHFYEAGRVGISGLLETKIINGEKAGDFELFYRNYLAENRLLVGDKMSVDGPHRSDFSVHNNALNLDAGRTSSGQMKLLLNKLVIAFAKLMAARRPDRALLILLDEADSHLDADARSELFSALSGAAAQVWLTGTNAAAFSEIDGCRVIAIHNS
ncbi:MAG: AAA family ATPase [Rickettsiales bacterium]|jgi:DNA replication and repair protein RecF|nr:AAA family ATPase [Rickettsiales bacterium]